MIAQVNIQYNTISNWVNLAKGEHICQFCGRSYPWKAALERHILKQHEVMRKEKMMSNKMGAEKCHIKILIAGWGR